MARELGQFLEMYPGSSFPTRSETSDGEICVVKMRGAGNGAPALLTEFVVNRLCARAGLPVPDATIIHIPENYPWNFGSDEFYDLVKKSAGPNLALTWVEGGKSIDPSRYNALPDSLVAQVVTIDLAFANWDRTTHSTNLLEDRARKKWIIDHGSCRFLFQQNPKPRTLPSNHIFTEWAAAFDPNWFKSITRELIAETIAEIPDLWLFESGLTRENTAQRINACLLWA